ncbi:MAG: hypothetical protein D6720_11515 [Gammaproteobacteria bacterium]|nr:MAG: hypothetical protein D6720_11515 [Gammaproteobacteria bacterium]
MIMENRAGQVGFIETDRLPGPAVGFAELNLTLRYLQGLESAPEAPKSTPGVERTDSDPGC